MEKYRVEIYGKTVEKIYFNKPFGRISWDHYKISDDLLWEGEISTPAIEEGEKIFISTLDIKAVVEERARNIEGGFYYYTDHIVKQMVNEESLVKAEKIKNEYEEKENVTFVKDISVQKKWYQFWK